MAWHATTAGYATAIDGLGFTYIPLLVNAVLSNGMGKFGSSISNAVVVEIDDLLSLVAEHADPAQRQIVTNAIAGQDIYDYVNVWKIVAISQSLNGIRSSRTCCSTCLHRATNTTNRRISPRLRVGSSRGPPLSLFCWASTKSTVLFLP